MIPGVLAQDVAHALREFIITGFETDTWPFQGKFAQLVEGDDQGSAFLKGPYVSINLPFAKMAAERRDFFEGFETAHSPFVHQQQAWDRLVSSGRPRSTVIATGTGSGKTECFLYPLLDHCLRHQAPGIKAVIIYPMNALAGDQAKRFAAVVHDTPALRGKVRVGLFIGGQDARGQTTMTAEGVITCKHTMRRHPPDILLTNYKMLDFLLIRPQDQGLWQHNTPETLRYLVVDELHTFDGAQGSDLALLIRRLRARLGAGREQVCCIGTSATLGDPTEGAGLRDYAGKVFDADFDRDSIIGESRERHDQFVKPVQDMLLDPDFDPKDLDAARFATLGDYLQAQVRLFFSDYGGFDPESAADREELGRRLQGHVLLHNLLLLAGGGPVALGDLLPAIQRQAPAALKGHVPQVLVSLLSLLAHARGTRYPGEPFVTLRVQLWARELRRIVARIGNDSAKHPVRLRFADDLKKEEGELFLPVVQCNECHATAWVTGQAAGEQRVERDLRQVYTWFFEKSRELKVLLPLEDEAKPPPMDGLVRALCSQCGRLVAADKTCCEADAMVRVFEPDLKKERKRGGVAVLESERICPVCQAQNSLLLFGSQAASLCSVAIQQLFADPVNDDKKLIAFSDSVQDAAHRAGFFTARTWQNNFRMGLAKALRARGGRDVPLQALFAYFPRYWLEDASNLERLAPLDYIVEFIAPNLQTRGEYTALRETGALAEPMHFIGFINRRLAWEILAEFSARSRIGRSLERTGVAALGWDPALIGDAAARLVANAREHLGYALAPKTAEHMLWGIALRMKRQGAVYDPVLDPYIKDGAQAAWLHRTGFGRKRNGPRGPSFMPDKVGHASLPRFPAEQKETGFDVLLPGRQKTWYSRWVLHLTQDAGLGEPLVGDVLLEAMAALVASGLARELRSNKGTRLWALNPERLVVATALAGLRLRRHGSKEDDTLDGTYGSWFVPAAWVPHLEGMPSLDYVTHGGAGPARYEPNPHPRASMYGRLYTEGALRRVIGHEHTALLERRDREALEQRFMAGPDEHQRWHENLLSATPTLEMGIDIGDLSSVMLCSVPPAGANYLQRAGRGGRRDGNAFVMTLANGRPHDLYFFADPMRMLAGRIEAPAIFLDAVMVLRRQLLAFCFDQWGMDAGGKNVIPGNMKAVLDAVEVRDMGRFPFTLLDFIARNRDDLWEKFAALLGGESRAETLARLKAYLLGTRTEEEDSLHVYLVERLQLTVDDRKSLERHKSGLQQELRRLMKLPKDEARDNQMEEVEDELEQIKQLRTRLDTRHTLQFFTDEGLLPNYAFPEEGTTLRSVIYQRLSSPVAAEGGGTTNYRSKTYEYRRPAHAALSELAPENTFYASSRKVEIDRVELAQGELIEEWRLCPSCSHSTPIAGAESGGPCPRCGDPMWADEQQRMHMVRLRQVYANTREEDAFISDDSDTREPAFYNDQMLVDFDRGAITLAYAAKTDTRAFGFEFIKKATFREINFGKQDGKDQTFKVDGREFARPGFRLCRACGTVQKKAKKPRHTFRCKYRDADSGEGIVDCLYLYREYYSEAVRILMPRLSLTQADEQRQSFVAAVQLGLKEKFGGKVDHLNLMLADEPIPGTEERSNFLVLYDTVPGGTGYLHTLLQKPDDFLDMLRCARGKMAACTCQEAPDLDGCYNCLFAYRNSYGMEHTSRRTALAMLEDILDETITWEEVENLDKVKKPTWADSELERRFPEAVEAMAQSQHLQGLRVRITKDVINGKVGFKLEVGTEMYTVEPHARLGPGDGAAYHCEPDFLLTRDRAETSPVKVAVFLDGWEYHKQSVHVDLMNRQGLFLNANILTWSLTWYDLSQAFAASEANMPNVYREHTDRAPVAGIKELAKRHKLDGDTRYTELPQLALLLHFLAEPNWKAWRGRAMLQALRWTNHEQMCALEQKAAFETASQQWPSGYTEACNPSALMFWSRADWHHAAAALCVYVAGPKGVLDGSSDEGLVVCVVCELRDVDDVQARHTWQRLLQILNYGQFLPRFFAATPQGIREGHYTELNWSKRERKAVDPHWEKVFDLVDPELQALVALLADNGAAAPVVGYELSDERGATIAEAELAWESARVAVLRADQQEDSAAAFVRHGWTVCSLTDTDALLSALTGDKA